MYNLFNRAILNLQRCIHSTDTTIAVDRIMTLRICMEKYIDKHYLGSRVSYHDYRNKDDVYNRKNPVYEIHVSRNKKDRANLFLVGCSPFCIVQMSRDSLFDLNDFERSCKVRLSLFMDGNDPVCIDSRAGGATYHLGCIIGNENYTVVQLPVPNTESVSH